MRYYSLFTDTNSTIFIGEFGIYYICICCLILALAKGLHSQYSGAASKPDQALPDDEDKKLPWTACQQPGQDQRGHNPSGGQGLGGDAWH